MDLDVWNEFLDYQEVFCRPLMDFSKTWTASEVDFYMDSAGSTDLGFGGICDDSWMMQKWPRNWFQKCEPSIEYLELFTLTVGVINWISKFANKRVVIFCDNMSVVCMVNGVTASCKNCMVLIRILTLQGMKHNVRIYA